MTGQAYVSLLLRKSKCLLMADSGRWGLIGPVSPATSLFSWNDSAYPGTVPSSLYQSFLIPACVVWNATLFNARVKIRTPLR